MSKASPGSAFSSIWDALEDTPEAAENMRCRSKLMFALKEHIKAAGLSLAQAEAASASGVTQPRISDLVRGKINPRWAGRFGEYGGSGGVAGGDLGCCCSLTAHASANSTEVVRFQPEAIAQALTHQHPYEPVFH